jgi:hypothetical protein
MASKFHPIFLMLALLAASLRGSPTEPHGMSTSPGLDGIAVRTSMANQIGVFLRCTGRDDPGEAL